MNDQPVPIDKITIRILALARALTSFEGFKNNLSVFIELINIGKIEKDKGAVGEKRKVRAAGEESSSGHHLRCAGLPPDGRCGRLFYFRLSGFLTTI